VTSSAGELDLALEPRQLENLRGLRERLRGTRITATTTGA